MKVKRLIFLMLVLLLLLSGCSNVSQTDYYNVQTDLNRTENKIDNQDQEISEVTASAEEVNDDLLNMLPVAGDDIPSLPSGNEYLDNPEFRQCLAEALAELSGSFEINDIDIYIEDERDGDISLIVYVDTDIRPIAVNTHYLGLVDSWVYSVIRDANLDHVYYPSLYKTHDFYTDEPIN